ncbi:MAG: hypothetical protein P3W96_006345 [Halomonas sp.]|nr:hypothetical protein [Halomonas sp.]MDM7481622.1 hypothetical protein [Halomonas sp.]
MALKNVSKFALLVAVAFSAIVLMRGLDARELMLAKAQAQHQAVNDFNTWKAQYQELLPLEEQWREQLPSVAKVRDLYSVAQLLGNTPTTPMDYLLVEKFEPVALGEVQLGASRVCLQSLGQPGVVFREPSFERLLQGLHTLAQRVDVEMGNVRLSVSENPDDGSTQAQALVSPLCLILRAEEGKAS